MCTCTKSWPDRAEGSSMKSRLMQSPRRVGTGSEERRQAVKRWSALTRWQVGQVLMYSSTAADRPGHHTERRASVSVLSRPKWYRWQCR